MSGKMNGIPMGCQALDVSDPGLDDGMSVRQSCDAWLRKRGLHTEYVDFRSQVGRDVAARLRVAQQEDAQ